MRAIVEKTLYDVRKDAYKKIKMAREGEGILLADAIASLKKLLYTVRREGLLAMEREASEIVESDYLKMLITLVVGRQSREMITELGANEYWTKDPQGIQAMVYYIYLIGALYIYDRWNPNVMQEALLTFVPERCRQEVCEKMGLEVPWLTFRNEDTETKFYRCYPTFESEKLVEKLEVLDKNIRELKDMEVKKIFLEIEDRLSVNLDDDFCKIDDFWTDGLIKIYAYFLYGLSEEARRKVLDRVPNRFAYRIMETVVKSGGSFSQIKILRVIEKVLDIMKRLCDEGEIAL